MARRQEQEPARAEVVEVGRDVLRLELPIRLPGLGHVNCYAIVDGDGAALVDPGLPGPGSWRVLTERLRRAGLAVRNVHTVVVTHSHPDHFGGAARIARESGARIVAHRSFSFGPPPTVAVPEARVTPWGGSSPRPPLRIRLKWMAMRWLGGRIVPAISHPVEHGDVLELADREWFVVHTPGHTGDHFCLHDPETGTFVAGDHVLPTITPHISGLTSSPDPLSSYFYSLDRVAELRGVEQVLPAHGHPFVDLAARTRAIKRHHEERLEKLVQLSKQFGKPSTVKAFSRLLFPPRSWGAMAESETYAHLEHLRLAGRAERVAQPGGAVLYVAG